MIVRPRPGRLQLITQPDHARMAGQVMTRCEPLARHPRRDSILRACAEHDGGWIVLDEAPSIDPATGAVIDFMTASAAAKQGVWPRAVARLDDDPWAAALVAQHAVTVYERHRADPEWAGFFPAMEAHRDRLARERGLGTAALADDYPYVRLADLISLTFCAEWTDENRFGPWTVSGAGTHVRVAPDAFGGRVAFQIAAREIPRRRYASDADLREATEVALAGTVGISAGTPDSRTSNAPPG
jgi:hypothetical protein